MSETSKESGVVIDSEVLTPEQRERLDRIRRVGELVDVAVEALFTQETDFVEHVRCRQDLDAEYPAFNIKENMRGAADAQALLRNKEVRTNGGRYELPGITLPDEPEGVDVRPVISTLEVLLEMEEIQREKHIDYVNNIQNITTAVVETRAEIDQKIVNGEQAQEDAGSMVNRLTAEQRENAAMGAIIPALNLFAENDYEGLYDRIIGGGDVNNPDNPEIARMLFEDAIDENGRLQAATYNELIGLTTRINQGQTNQLIQGTRTHMRTAVRNDKDNQEENITLSTQADNDLLGQDDTEVRIIYNGFRSALFEQANQAGRDLNAARARVNALTNDVIFLDIHTLGYLDAHPERRGDTEEGERKQMQRVGLLAEQISLEIVPQKYTVVIDDDTLVTLELPGRSTGDPGLDRETAEKYFNPEEDEYYIRQLNVDSASRVQLDIPEKTVLHATNLEAYIVQDVKLAILECMGSEPDGVVQKVFFRIKQFFLRTINYYGWRGIQHYEDLMGIINDVMNNRINLENPNQDQDRRLNRLRRMGLGQYTDPKAIREIADKAVRGDKSLEIGDDALEQTILRRKDIQPELQAVMNDVNDAASREALTRKVQDLATEQLNRQRLHTNQPNIVPAAVVAENTVQALYQHIERFAEQGLELERMQEEFTVYAHMATVNGRILGWYDANTDRNATGFLKRNFRRLANVIYGGVTEEHIQGINRGIASGRRPSAVAGIAHGVGATSLALVIFGTKIFAGTLGTLAAPITAYLYSTGRAQQQMDFTGMEELARDGIYNTESSSWLSPGAMLQRTTEYALFKQAGNVALLRQRIHQARTGLEQNPDSATLQEQLTNAIAEYQVRARMMASGTTTGINGSRIPVLFGTGENDGVLGQLQTEVVEVLNSGIINRDQLHTTYNHLVTARHGEFEKLNGILSDKILASARFAGLAAGSITGGLQVVKGVWDLADPTSMRYPNSAILGLGIPEAVAASPIEGTVSVPLDNGTEILVPQGVVPNISADGSSISLTGTNASGAFTVDVPLGTDGVPVINDKIINFYEEFGATINTDDSIIMDSAGSAEDMLNRTAEGHQLPPAPQGMSWVQVNSAFVLEDSNGDEVLRLATRPDGMPIFSDQLQDVLSQYGIQIEPGEMLSQGNIVLETISTPELGDVNLWIPEGASVEYDSITQEFLVTPNEGSEFRIPIINGQPHYSALIELYKDEFHAIITQSEGLSAVTDHISVLDTETVRSIEGYSFQDTSTLYDGWNAWPEKGWNLGAAAGYMDSGGEYVQFTQGVIDNIPPGVETIDFGLDRGYMDSFLHTGIWDPEGANVQFHGYQEALEATDGFKPNELFVWMKVDLPQPHGTTVPQLLKIDPGAANFDPDTYTFSIPTELLGENVERIGVGYGLDPAKAQATLTSVFDRTSGEARIPIPGTESIPEFIVHNIPPAQGIKIPDNVPFRPALLPNFPLFPQWNTAWFWWPGWSAGSMRSNTTIQRDQTNRNDGNSGNSRSNKQHPLNLRRT